MFLEEITVELPLKKRIRRTKPYYVYEILQRKSKVNDKEISVCVGKYIDGNKMNPNLKYYELHPECELPINCSVEQLFSNQISIGANAVIREIAGKEGLLSILQKHFSGYADLILSLIEYYLIEQNSAAQLYKFYAENHFTGLNYIPSESTISNLFNKILSEKNVSLFLQDWLNYRVSKIGDSKIDIDFDSTNFNISSKKIIGAEYGHSKVNEGLPQINVAYFLERKTGLPIYYDIYYGSINDMEHCNLGIEKIKKINSKINASLVLDRGYFSQKNLEFLRKNNFDFVCMGKTNAMLDRLIDEYNISKITKTEFWIKGTTYGVKLNDMPFSKSKENYHIYLFYDNSNVSEITANKLSYYSYYSKMIIGKFDKDNHIQNTYGKMLNIEKDENNIIISTSINNEAMDEFKKSCGYYYLVSSEDLSLSEILDIYKYRDIVEKQIKYNKSGCDLNKTYAQADKVFCAKRFMSFICSIIRASIILNTRPFVLQYSNETSQTILKELDKIRLEKIVDQYVLKSSITAKQKQILSLFYISSDQIKNIGKQVNDCLKI